MTQSSCKREARSKSHPGSKLAPVRVFLCKHPLSLCVVCFRAPNSQTWFISEILNFCSRYRQTRSYISSLKVKYILVGHYFGKSCNDRGYVDPPEVPSLHWNINFWQWVDICPFPRSRPLMRSERQIPEPCNNWSEDLRLVFPHPIRNLVWTSRSLLYVQ